MQGLNPPQSAAPIQTQVKARGSIQRTSVPGMALSISWAHSLQKQYSGLQVGEAEAHRG